MRGLGSQPAAFLGRAIFKESATEGGSLPDTPRPWGSCWTSLKQSSYLFFGTTSHSRVQTDTLWLRMAPKALHSGSLEGYRGTDPGSTESHHYLDELLNERKPRWCYRGSCEFVTGSPYSHLLNEFSQVAASPEAHVLGASVPPLVSKHLLNLRIEWILLSQDVGPLVLHLLPEVICQQL